MKASEFQEALRDAAVEVLRLAGIVAEVRVRTTPKDEAVHELDVVVAFEHCKKRCELWIYADEAGFDDGAGEWTSFDLDDFASLEDLGEAVLQHLEEMP